MIVDELFTACFTEHWNCERYRISGHAKEVKAKYGRHVSPTFGPMEYLGITRSQVREWHGAKRETPVTANRSIEILSRMYRFSVEKEWNQHGFNPCQSIKHFTERKRKRYASEDEIQIIGAILNRKMISYPVEMTFLFTLLYTGARPRSIERAMWRDLCETKDGYGVLTFDGKSTAETGDEESVIIPPDILKMLKKLPPANGLIFGIPLPSYLWRKIRAEAGCPDLWARDLRRTFATIGMSNNVEIGVIGELLNHHSTNTTKRYAKLDNRARVTAVGQISDKMNSILKVEKPKSFFGIKWSLI